MRSTTGPLAECVSSMNIKGWELQEGVADGAGGVKTLYFFKGQQAIRHTLSSYTARHLGGYFLLERDIRNIRGWVAAIIRIMDELGTASDDFARTLKRKGDPEKNNLIKGLFVAVLAIYGKLFTTAKGRRVSLNASIFTDSKHLGIHQSLMELRHSFAAHSGEESHEKCEIVVALVPERDGVAYKLFSELSQPNHFSRQGYREIDDLMAFLHRHVLRKREELLKRVRQRDLADGEVNCLIQLYRKSGVLAGHLRN